MHEGEGFNFQYSIGWSLEHNGGVQIGRFCMLDIKASV